MKSLKLILHIKHYNYHLSVSRDLLRFPQALPAAPAAQSAAVSNALVNRHVQAMLY